MPQSDKTTKAHYIDYLGIKALRSTHLGVRKIKRQQKGHSAHGNKVWRSSFVLIDYLTDNPPEKASTVLDIGCGWGLTGLFLAKQYQAKVTGIDIDPSVAPFLALQADLNHCPMNFQVKNFSSLSSADLAHYQTIIGTDICFWDEMTTPLFKLIKRAQNAGVQRILIADPGRPPFWNLADRCATAFSAEVLTRRIHKPWKSEKHILLIDKQKPRLN